MYGSEQIGRLEGTSGQEKGGLIIMKKGPATDVATIEFKKPEIPPSRSLLGLDRLAAAKREELSFESQSFRDHKKIASKDR